MKEERLVFYKDDTDEIHKILEDFLKLSGAKCNLLIDKDGHTITKVGDVENLDIQAVAALIAGSFAATKQMAKLLGEEEFSVLFHQGKRDSIQLSLAGERSIIATVFDNKTTAGMVRLYSNEATRRLSRLFEQITQRKGELQEHLHKGFADTAISTMDELFKKAESSQEEQE